MHTFVFLDANVLLHFRFFDEVDWPRELAVDAVTLVFAPMTLAELDHKKWSGSRRERTRAKAVLKKVDALRLSNEPVKVRHGVDAIALDAEPSDALFVRHRLHTQSNDDRLLASYLDFREAHGADRASILSADSGLSVKARSRQIELLSPAEHLELAEEPDEIERELEKARREVAELRSAAPDLRLTFGDGEAHAVYTIPTITDFDAEALASLLSAWRSRHPYAAATPTMLASLGAISFKNLAGFPGFVSEEDARSHNAELDRHYAQYESFVRSWPGILNRQARILTFEFVLENEGTAPADDVDVRIWTDARGSWLEEVPELPVPPRVPRTRGPFDMPHLTLPTFAGLPADAFIRAAENVDGPNISTGGAQQRVQYGVKRVKHHVPCELPPVHFLFDTGADLRSFTTTVRIVAANIRKPQSATLHVEIEREAPVAPTPPSDLEDDDD